MNNSNYNFVVSVVRIFDIIHFCRSVRRFKKLRFYEQYLLLFVFCHSHGHIHALVYVQRPWSYFLTIQTSLYGNSRFEKKNYLKARTIEAQIASVCPLINLRHQAASFEDRRRSYEAIKSSSLWLLRRVIRVTPSQSQMGFSHFKQRWIDCSSVRVCTDLQCSLDYSTCPRFAVRFTLPNGSEPSPLSNSS